MEFLLKPIDLDHLRTCNSSLRHFVDNSGERLHDALIGANQLEVFDVLLRVLSVVAVDFSFVRCSVRRHLNTFVQETRRWYWSRLS